MEQKTTSIFEMIVWAGAGISAIGLVGIIWSILRVARARKAGLSDDEMKAVLQSIIPLNLGSLMLSILGLMMVGVGIALS